MKRLISFLSAVLCIAFFGGCNNAANFVQPDESKIIYPFTMGNDVDSNRYEGIYEDQELKILLNSDTAAFQIIDKKSKVVYASSPENAENASDLALFEITYLDSSGLIASMNSYTDSVKKGQYTVDTITNGVKIHFTLGNVEEKLYCPNAISKDRMESLLNKIDDTYSRTLFKSYYYLVEYEKLDKNKKSSLSSKHPVIKDTPLYILRQENLPLNTKRKINEILLGTGYDDEQYEIDSANTVDTVKTAYPIFNIPLYILVEDGGIKLRIPMEEVDEYNGASILNIEVARAFGSPERNDHASFLLPDGSGSIMNCYNGKTGVLDYEVSIYGNDRAVQKDESIFKQNQAYLPVFAKIYEKSSMFCILTEGDSLASIIANPGNADNYAVAYPKFRVREYSKSYLNSSTKNANDYLYITQAQPYDGALEVYYKFFNSEEASLENMSLWYSDYLFGDKYNNKSAPVVLEFIGSARRETKILGLNVTGQVVFTTLNDVKSIGHELLNSGVSNMVFVLKGFFNGGLDQPFAADLQLNNKTGSKEDLKALQDWASKNNIPLYFDADIQYVYRNSLFDSFNLKKDTAYLVTKTIGKDAEYNPATYQIDYTNNMRYILSPDSVVRAARGFAVSMEKLKVNNYSFSYAGQDLNGDYRESENIKRQETLTSLIGIFGELKSQEDSMITKGANAYALPYMDGIRDVSLSTNIFDTADMQVPFVQMVLQGRVWFTDNAVNLNGSTPELVMDTLRSGAGFMYTLTSDSELDFNNTRHTELYSTKYGLWKNDILKKSKLLEDTANMGTITGFSLLSEAVYKTDYSSGHSIITNYSDKVFKKGSVTAESKSYVIIKGGE